MHLAKQTIMSFFLHMTWRFYVPSAISFSNSMHSARIFHPCVKLRRLWFFFCGSILIWSSKQFDALRAGHRAFHYQLVPKPKLKKSNKSKTTALKNTTELHIFSSRTMLLGLSFFRRTKMPQATLQVSGAREEFLPQMKHFCGSWRVFALAHAKINTISTNRKRLPSREATLDSIKYCFHSIPFTVFLSLTSCDGR